MVTNINNGWRDGGRGTGQYVTPTGSPKKKAPKTGALSSWFDRINDARMHRGTRRAAPRLGHGRCRVRC